MWFDPGPNVGYVLPGQVMEYHRSAQVVVVQSVIGGMVRHISPRYAQKNKQKDWKRQVWLGRSVLST